jgi:hypothetical protein
MKKGIDDVFHLFPFLQSTKTINLLKKNTLKKGVSRDMLSNVCCHR